MLSSSSFTSAGNNDNSAPSYSSSSSSNNCSSLSDDVVIVITGPTGVGKSDVAARLCVSSHCKKGGMIVSADSVQVFDGVDIGANKPSQQERTQTPHLLIDTIKVAPTTNTNPSTSETTTTTTSTYNAAEWQRDALYCIEQLLCTTPKKNSTYTSTTTISKQRRHELSTDINRGRHVKNYEKDESLRPIIVGGTMMYVQWLVHGRPAEPTNMKPTSLQIVQRAMTDMEQFQTPNDRWNDAVQFVSNVGGDDNGHRNVLADRTKQLSEGDWYRLRRTLEIAYTVMNNKADDNDNKESADDDERRRGLFEKLFTGEREGGLTDLGYDVRCFFLCPDDRMKHTEVVDRRCEEMVIRGLLKETTDLYMSRSLPTMAARAIGYRQALEYLTRPNAVDNDGTALDAFLNNFTTATRRYAKKQMQWYRKDDSFLFIPVPLSESKEVRISQTADAIERFCSMTRTDYEKELLQSSGNDDDDDGLLSASEQMKRTNEEQGKTMKFYQFKRYLIKPGTDVFRDVMEQADDCTRRMKGQST